MTKLSSAGNALTYSTYLGGSGNSYDIGSGIAVDRYDCAYVAGFTSGPDFPTQDPYQTDQGGMDAFLTKLSSTGNSLLYCTYLGGSDNDYGRGIAIDSNGYSYVTGETWSTDFPTQNPFQTDMGNVDVFVTKLSSAGSSLVYSTYLGGNSEDHGWGIAVDNTSTSLQKLWLHVFRGFLYGTLNELFHVTWVS